jgi:pimeloyl-ACP methyl ester carboxylesterase
MLDDVKLRKRFVVTNGVRLHLVEAGPQDGPPVLLLHGFPELWYGWRHQIGPLAEAGYHVLVPDQRGFNLSAKPPGIGAYRLDLLGLDMTGLLDELGLSDAFVVGHDWGGVVAWWLGIAHPERVRKLVVLNIPHPMVMRRFLRRDLAQIRRSWYIFFFQLPWLPEFWLRRRDWRIAELMLRTTSRRGTFRREELARYREAWAQPGSPKSMLQWYRAALRRPPPIPADVRVSPPTRILWGTDDIALGREMVPPSAELCDSAEVFYFEGASHWLQHEEAEAVNQHLLEFFAPVEAIRPTK